MARPNEGRRGGYRMLVGYKEGSRAVFLFGFAETRFDNVEDDQLTEIRLPGQVIISADLAALETI